MIFEHKNYKDFLFSKLSETRGLRSRLAEHLSCHPAYLSKVLNGNSHLNLEQGDKINKFFSHNISESKYFLVAINLGRAGTKSLARHYEKELKEIKREASDLKNSFSKNQNMMTLKVQTEYYSHWLYTAIDSLTSSGIASDVETISKYLRIQPQICSKFVGDLLNWNVLTRDKNGSFQGKQHVHLNKNSANIQKHHVNWRLQALKSIDFETESDLHYSGIYTISEKDSSRLQQMFVEQIQNAAKVVKVSTPEKMKVLCLDFFTV